MIQQSQTKKSVTIDVLLLILLIYLTSGFNGGISGTIILSISLLIAIYFLIKNSSGVIFPNMISMFISLSLIILISISLIIEQANIKQTFIVYGNLCISIILAVSFNYKNYNKLFVYAMRVITINSLFSFFIAIFFPLLIQLSPTFINSAGTKAHLFGASFVILSANIRNLGIFWEPGAFQTFLVMVILIEFHTKDNQSSGKFLVIHMVALLTTFSTTGFVGLLLLIMYIIISTKKFSDKLKYILVFISFSILFLFLFINNNDYLRYAFFDKLLAMFDPNTTSGTASVRQDSIIYPTQKFLESPIFGVGATGLSELEQITGHTMNTFTPINWYARWGIFFGTIMMLGLWKFTRFMTADIFKRLLIFGIIIVSVSTEEFSLNPSFLIYPLLGMFYNTKTHKAVYE